MAEALATLGTRHDRAVRWGIVGTGGIAAAFAADLRVAHEAGELVAVASRTPERAEAFAVRIGAPRAYGTHEQLASDPDIDVVYVAVPHTAHHGAAELALDAGKAVLVEKPFTVNRREAEDLVTTARSRGLFLMEAMWTRFLPQAVEIRRLIAQGRPGELRLVLAQFGVRFEYDPTSRMFDPALGGGALLDLGVYTISFAAMVLGTPTELTATADFGPTGVDAQTAVTLHYPGGPVTVSSMESWPPNGAMIAGRDAHVDVDGMFYRPTSFMLTDRHGEQERFDGWVAGGGMQFEALEVARCLRAGLTESLILPLEETLSIMETLDRARAAIGLRYPGERPA